MITVICGLIGAGKSTYARAHYEYVTECEAISKERQILDTLKLDDAGKTVAHVTCYPTQEERDSFKNRNVHYVWINTDPAQAMLNICERGRERDLEDLPRLDAKNQELFTKLAQAGFEEIEVFKTTERW